MQTTGHPRPSHAYRSLAAIEPVFDRLLTEYGPQDPFVWHDGGRTGSSRFAAMLIHIIGQRTSAVTTFVIYDRILAACGRIPRPTDISELGADRLRQLGLSGAKAGYVLDLAARQADGRIDLDTMGELGDDEVVAILTAGRGIGEWTAQMFLMRQLKRPDVFPSTDLGLREAITSLWTVPAAPTPTEAARRAAPWSPYRSYAAALLWRSLAPLDAISDAKERALNRLNSRAP
jgi:DNA-3-methyladenine glycosylase II